jgi:hypothetical protein
LPRGQSTGTRHGQKLGDERGAGFVDIACERCARGTRGDRNLAL